MSNGVYEFKITTFLYTLNERVVTTFNWYKRYDIIIDIRGMTRYLEFFLGYRKDKMILSYRKPIVEG